MCENHEKVLSDVHIFTQPIEVNGNTVTSDSAMLTRHISRFKFRIPCWTHGYDRFSFCKKSLTSTKETDPPEKVKCKNAAENICVPPSGDGSLVDEDGDLIRVRPSSRSNTHLDKEEDFQDVVTIEHCMGTTLADVGLQVWRGSLLMCDLILHNMDKFKDCIAVELGGGVGLSSIVMAMVAKRVICTDVGDEILSKCQQNVISNRSLFGSLSSTAMPPNRVLVRELDWTRDLNRNLTPPFSWRKEDEENLSKATVIFAADVVYDNHLTDALFQTLGRLMKLGCKKNVYITIERRYNFTLSDFDVTCKEYDHFRSLLTSLAACTEHDSIKYEVHQICIDFPQFFSYERVKQLELWQITSLNRDPCL